MDNLTGTMQLEAVTRLMSSSDHEAPKQQVVPLLGEILDEGPWPDPVSVPLDPERAAMADAFRLAMRRLAAGVCAVTVRHQGEIFGLTATSVTSLSMDPPSLLTSIRSTSKLLQALRREKRFTVHVLGEHQAYEANAFAGRIDKGDGRSRADLVQWADDGLVNQRLAGATCHIDCRVQKLMPIFSHIVTVGVVERVDIGATDRPLIFFDGNFHSIGE